jgi:hypothetical protein
LLTVYHVGDAVENAASPLRSSLQLTVSRTGRIRQAASGPIYVSRAETSGGFVREDSKTRVVVLGGGVSGMRAAFELITGRLMQEDGVVVWQAGFRCRTPAASRRNASVVVSGAGGEK